MSKYKDWDDDDNVNVPKAQKKIVAESLFPPTAETGPFGPESILVPAKGRTPTWPYHIDAPQPALEFYKALAKVANTEAFKFCHVFTGATSEKWSVPLVRYHGKLSSLPMIIDSFMGLCYGAKICKTKNCINPFHYVQVANVDMMELSASGNSPVVNAMVPDSDNPTALPFQDGEGFIDLLDYYIEEVGIAPTYDALRNVIPMEDLSDSDLQTTLPVYKARKGLP